jgi:RNA polymerase sigma-70 factor (ECF subfamily)
MAAIVPRPATDQALLAGGADAFAAFYRRHEDDVLRYFLRRVARADLAADLTAETFAAALAGRASYDPDRGDARGWLFGIARHLLARSLERGRVENDARRRLQMERVVVDEQINDRIHDLTDGQPALDALDALPDDQRVAVRGRVLSGRDYAELARRLECSESVVRQRVSRGLRTLRTRLERTR